VDKLKNCAFLGQVEKPGLFLYNKNKKGDKIYVLEN